MTQAGEKTVRLLITGRVQGVGFRFWTYDQANRRSLAGWVRNNPDGSVEALFSGLKEDVDDMLEACWQGPRFSSVANIELLSEEKGGGEALFSFEIRR